MVRINFIAACNCKLHDTRTARTTPNRGCYIRLQPELAGWPCHEDVGAWRACFVITLSCTAGNLLTWPGASNKFFKSSRPDTCGHTTTAFAAHAGGVPAAQVASRPVGRPPGHAGAMFIRAGCRRRPSVFPATQGCLPVLSLQFGGRRLCWQHSSCCAAAQRQSVAVVSVFLLLDRYDWASPWDAWSRGCPRLSAHPHAWRRRVPSTGSPGALTLPVPIASTVLSHTSLAQRPVSHSPLFCASSTDDGCTRASART